jgi:uncharacterized damage-inducible protein DinB
MLVKEMEEEAVTTRKMLERVPASQFAWQPHVKSMTLLRLAAHVAELPTWISMALNTSELDFTSGDYQPVVVNNSGELLEYFEKNLAQARLDLNNATEAQLEEMWTFRSGDKVHSIRPKAEVLRMTFCQTVHHRAQLGVYLRLLDIPIPGSYGPSADEGSMY